MQTLAPGLSGQRSLIVEERHTAAHLGSGGAPVYATPMMVLAMEEAALSAVDPLLEPGKATVGYSLDIQHLAATPIGMRVTATATLLSIAGKMLTFHVEARDERELIGKGTHIRAIIDLERFRTKLAAKSLPAS
jgi:predicted thioesterase